MHIRGVPLVSFFDTVAGLPTHPLVVHVAVVLLPLSALALVAIIAVRRWRAAYGWLTMAGLAVGAAGAVLAAQTGEALAVRVGLPADHARWGDLLEKAGVVLLVVAAMWFVLQRRSGTDTERATCSMLLPIVQRVAAGLSIVMAASVLVLTVVVGHSGATAVWAGRDAVAGSSAGAAPGSPTPSASSGNLTMSEVRVHATASNCWSVVDGNVYDLTTWIPQHPGGSAVIEALCGKDGSAAFHGQHASERAPGEVLAGFRIGTLGQ